MVEAHAGCLRIVAGSRSVLRQRQVTPRNQIARAISIVGHPMLLVPLAIVLAMRGRVSFSQGAGILAVVVAAILVVAAYLVHGVRTGRLSHVDVSKREERGTFYRVAMVSTAIATVALAMSGAPRAAAFGCGCAFGLLAVSSIVNRTIKASLHTAFGIVAAGTVGPGSPLVFATFLAMALLVAWSRVVLGRHTTAEVLVGALLGTLAAIALHLGRHL